MANERLTQTHFFEAALQEARKAFDKNETPIGAVIVKEGKIIARAYNETERRGSHLAHAEILALERASRRLGTKYLYDCSLYITLEPCKMCRGAAALARLSSIHYLTSSQKFGRRGPAYFKTISRKFRSSLDIENQNLLSSFFKRLRGLAE